METLYSFNDNDPRDKIFDHVWEDLKIIKQYGTISLPVVEQRWFNAFFQIILKT